MKKKTKEEVLRSIEDLSNGKIIVLDMSNYKNTKSKILVNDISCDHPSFSTTYNKIQQGLRCPKCGNIKSKNGERLTQERLNEKLNSNIFFDEYKILNFNEYENIHKKNMKIRHLKCGNEFTTKMNNFFNLHGCPYCRTSRIEIIFENYLLENNISYKMHYRKLPGLKGKAYPLEIDFVINSKEKLYLELNGEFHYGDGGNVTRDRLSETIKNDNLKIEYFLNNNKTFMVIPYWHFDEVSKILCYYLNSDFDNLMKYNLTFIRDKKYIQKISSLD